VSGRLPKPEGWRPQVLLIVAAVVVVPVFFGTTLWWLIASLLNGQYASTVVAIVPPHTRKGDAPLIVCAVLALMGAFTMIKGYRHRTMGQVRLTAKGFRVYESGKEFGGKWADVEKVTSAPPPARTRSERKVKPVVFNMTDGSVLAINGVESYTPGGAALYWMVRYYFRNPEKRGETHRW
jgi:hypothetical protein